LKGTHGGGASGVSLSFESVGRANFAGDLVFLVRETSEGKCDGVGVVGHGRQI